MEQKGISNRILPETVEKLHKATTDIVLTHMNNVDVQPMAGTVLGAAELIISSECAGARAERCQEMATEKNAETFTICTKT